MHWARLSIQGANSIKLTYGIHNSGLLYRILTKSRAILVNLGVFFPFLSLKRRLRALKTPKSKSGAKTKRRRFLD